MAQLSKQALIVGNNTSFPNNTTNYITPAILRSFNVDMIDSFVDEIPYGAYTQSVNSSLNSLNQFTASAAGLSTGSLLVTASANINVITFTKGDGTTFNVTVADTTNLTPLNQFTASQATINTAIGASTSSLNSATASLFTSASLSLTTASVNLNTITFTKGDKSTFAITVNTGSSTASIPTGTISGSQQITALGFVSSSVTASSLVTASVNVNILTFTKGDGSQFNLTVAASGSVTPGTVSGSAQIVGLGFLQTSSFQTYTSSIDNKFISVGASTASLNTYTQSNDTKWTTLGGQTGSYITSAQTSSMSVATASIALAVSTSISSQNLQHFVTFVDNSTGTQAIYVDGGIKYNPNQDLLLVNNITSSGYISASSLNLSGTLTASLQTGYVWVGNSGNVSTIVATSSFAAVPLTSLNAYTASNDTKWNTLQTTTASFSASVASISALTGSYATTGSNSFIGTEIITGSLILSGSTTPLIVSGNITQQGAFSFILSGSTSKVTINQNAVTIASGSVSGAQTQAILGRTIGITHISASNQIGIISNANSLGSYGPYPVIFVTSGSKIATYNPIQFQGANQYTDGRTTFTTPIQALAGEEVTGSLSVSGSKTIIGTNTVTGSMITTGSFILTGSAQGNVVSMSISSNTASMDLTKGNYFELTSSAVVPLRIELTNIKAGLTSTLIISASVSTSIVFSPNVGQPSPGAYSGSAAASTDILSFVAFNTSKANLVATKNII